MQARHAIHWEGGILLRKCMAAKSIHGLLAVSERIRLVAVTGKLKMI